MTTFETFRLYMQVDVFKCPKAIVIKEIRNACIEFCDRTWILETDADDISVLDDTKEYTLAFDGALYTPVSIQKAFMDETQLTVTSKRVLDQTEPGWEILTAKAITSCFLTIQNKLRVYPIPTEDQDDDIDTLKVIVKPTLAAVEIDDFIYDEYLDVITWGALAELQDIPDKPWSDPKKAAKNRAKFSMAIANTSSKVTRGKTSVDALANYSGSSFF